MAETRASPFLANLGLPLLGQEILNSMPERYPSRYGVQLPPHRALCYKRYMRKWMSGRMKRRKKGPETSKERPQNAPEPLQPKYFESQIDGRSAEPAETAPQPSAAPRRAQQTVQEATGERETQADFDLGTRGAPELPLAEAVRNEGRTRPSRRRRKRGGGSGRGPSQRQSSAPRPADAPIRTQTAEASDPSATDLAVIAPEEGVLTPEAIGEMAAPAAPSVPAPRSSATEAPLPVAQGVSGIPATVPPARPSKGTVVLSIGLPGSGKSSWFKRHNIRPLSSDLLRELLFDDEQEQRFQDLVFSNLRSMLKARLIARRPMSYVDATNLTPHDRHSWIKLAKDYGYDVQGLFFDVPLEVCLERHQRRGRVVPEAIMRKMAAKLKPPTFEEGFSKITVVRVKQKDTAVS